MRQLGEELVTDEVTAIMELIKNSYDADASWVKITIDAKNELVGDEYYYKGDKSYIIIEDNGFGMDEKDIRDGWMVISLSKKRTMKRGGIKTPKGRTPLGDKGLGRLSTQRLGQKLDLITFKKNDNNIHQVAFDWNDFNDDTQITEVASFYKTRLKTSEKQGTKLVITKLREPTFWDGAGRAKFIGQISQLIFPYVEDRPFAVYLEINGDKIDLDEISDALRDQAVARFEFNFAKNELAVEGKVKYNQLVGGATNQATIEEFETLIESDKGKDFFSFLTDPKANKKYFLPNLKFHGKSGIFYTFETKINSAGLSLEYEFNELAEKEVIADPGSFNGEIDEFYFTDSDTLKSAFDSLSEFKKIVQNAAGVRVFRDGFGIKPFGIDGNDWLQLGKSQTSGASFYHLRPGNVMGYISLSAEKNNRLTEKTDREGFTETPYSRNFFRIVSRVIDEINSVIENTRRSFNDYKKSLAQKKGGIKNINDSFRRLQETSNKAKRLQKEKIFFEEHLSDVSVGVKELVKNIFKKDYNESVFKQNKTLFQEIDKLLDEAKKIVNNIDSILEVAKKLEYDADFIGPKIRDLENQLSQFAELAGLGLTAEALSHEISNIIDRLIEQTNDINKKVKGKDIINTSFVYVYVEFIKSSIKALQKQLSHLAPSLRYVRETKENMDVEKFFSEMVDFYNDKFQDEIKVELKLTGYNFNIKMSKGKLTQVVDNIILNSQYWLRERAKQDKTFRAKIKIEISEPFVRISDNGFGVEPTYEERLFQPFVTSKPKNIGRGLGLFIVQQLLDTIGGEIILLNRKNEFERKYVFQINFSSIIG